MTLLRRLAISVSLSFLVSDWRVLLLLVAACIAAGVGLGAAVALVGPLIVLALVVGIVAALLMLRSVQWGLYATAAVAILLPFAAVPVDVGFKPTFLDLTLGAVFLVWFMTLAAGRVRTVRLAPIAPLVLAFLVVALAAFVGGLQHAGLDKNTLRRFGEVLISVALFFAVVDHVRRREQLEGLALVIALCGFVSAGIGIVLYLIPDALAIRLLSLLGRFDYPAGPGVLRFIEDNPELAQRATSTAIDPNVYGGMLLLLIAFLAPQLATPRPLLPRWATLTILVSMGMALVLTFSRGAMVGLAVALAPLMLLRYRRLIPYAAVAALLLLLLPQTQGYVSHFIAGLRGEDLATQMRFGEYKDALILIRRYPWFGVGFSGAPDIDLYVGVSSVYLLMAEQMGLIGLAVFLLLMLAFFVYAIVAIRRLQGNQAVEPILLGLVSAILGALFGGIFDHYFFNIVFIHSVTLFWLFAGLAMAAARIGLEQAEAAVAEPTPDAGLPRALAWLRPVHLIVRGAESPAR
ncbi:MAG TPA: O-antigen ligase family protein [Ardenticatenaceae bacterium]|nr:O-antigen ligase family protein [Ardenticatenaceae bacterium]